MIKPLTRLLLALAVIGAGWPLAAQTTSTFEAITVSTSAVGLTATTRRPGAGGPPMGVCTIRTEDQNIRWRTDGTPTATVGNLLQAGESIKITNLRELDRLLMIRQSADAAVSIDCRVQDTDTQLTGAGSTITGGGDASAANQATEIGHLANIVTATQLIDDPVATIGTTPLLRVALFDNADAQVTTFGGGTQYAVDTALGATPTGTLSVGIRDDALSTLTPVEGDAIGFRVDSTGGLWVANAGLTELATAIDTEMQVDIITIAAGDNNIGNMDVASIAAGDNDIGNVDVEFAGAAAAVNNGVASATTQRVTIASDSTGQIALTGAALTALQVIDNSVFADDGPFTLASSSVTMAGAIRDDALATLTAVEGDAVPLRVSATGALHVTGSSGVTEFNEDTLHSTGAAGNLSLVVRNDAGTALAGDGDYIPLMVNAAGALYVTGGGGGTEYVTNAVAPADPTGTTVIMERDDALTTLTELEGDWTNTRATAEGALWTQDFNSDAIRTAVELIDNAISGAGFNITQLNGAAVPLGAGVEATAVRVTLATDSTGVVSIDDNGGNLSVDWGGTAPPIGAGVEATALRVTLATDSTGVVSIDDNGGALTVDGSLTTVSTVTNLSQLGGAAVPIGAGLEATAVRVTLPTNGTGVVGTELPAPAALADTTANPTVPAVAAYVMAFNGTTWDRAQIATDVTEDAAEAGGESGPLVMTVRRDTAATSAGLTGDFATLNTDATGQLWVTDAAVLADTAAIQTALELLDNVLIVDDAAFTPATTTVQMVGFEVDDTTPNPAEEGDGGAARMSTRREIYTQLRDAAGNERGANVTASNELLVNCGNCTGSGVSHIDDAVFTATTDDVSPGGFLYDTTPPTITDGNAGVARMDSNRYQLVTVGAALPVGTNNIGDVDVLTFPDNEPFNVQQWGGSTATGGAGGVAAGTPRVTLASDDPAVTALQLIDNPVFVENQAFVLDTSSVFAIGARRDDVLGGLTSADGDIHPLHLDANGALWVIPSGTVTVSDGAGSMNVIIDSGTTAVTATNLDVQIGGSDTVSVAQATASSLNAQVVGNVASAATDSGNPVKIGGIFNTTQPTVTDGQRVNLNMSNRGAALVRAGVEGLGNLAHDAVDAGNPLKIGGYASTTTPTAVAGADRVNAWYTLNGAAMTAQLDPCSRFAKVYVPISQTTGTQLLTGTASNRTYVCHIDIVTATAQNIALISGTGTVCATSPGAMMGGTTAATGWNFAANGGISAGGGQAAIAMSDTDADNVCLLQSSTGQISGVLSYVVAAN